METSAPAVGNLARVIGCWTKNKPADHHVDATNTPFRAPSLLTAAVAKTCTELCLAGCELDKLDEVIGLFHGLRKLDLSENRISELPPDIGNLFSLKHLNLSSNLIKVLPDEFQYMKYLETALLFSNLIHSIPDVFHSMTCLVEFNIFNNRLLKIPPTMGKLCNATARSQAPLFLAETRGKGKKGDPLF
jgi:hypothetical protein